jgi:kynureninase
MVDPLLEFRREFPILASTNYLVSNSLGAMPRSVPDRLAEYVDQWAELGVKAWASGWWDMPIRAGDEIAPLLGAADGEVAMVPNVTIAQTSVLTSLDYSGPRNRVVMTAADFPSVRYVYERLATRLGADIVVVPGENGVGIDLERLLAAIDERTRLVSISHVLFKSAYIVDVAAVCRRA